MSTRLPTSISVHVEVHGGGVMICIERPGQDQGDRIVLLPRYARELAMSILRACVFAEGN